MAIRRDRKLKPRKDGPQKIGGRHGVGGTKRKVSSEQAYFRRRDVALLVKAQVEEEEIVSQILGQISSGQARPHWNGDVGESTIVRLIGEVKRELTGRAKDLKRELRDGLQLIRLIDELRFVRTLRTETVDGRPAQITPAQKADRVLRIEQEIAKHAGSYAPERHVHEIDLTQDKLDLLGAMSPDEVREVLEEEARRGAADDNDDG